MAFEGTLISTISSCSLLTVCIGIARPRLFSCVRAAKWPPSKTLLRLPCLHRLMETTFRRSYARLYIQDESIQYAVAEYMRNYRK
jgi:hypothetical protein